jgi:hypothetical protein
VIVFSNIVGLMVPEIVILSPIVGVEGRRDGT